MKGVELFSDIFLLFVLMAATVLIVAFVYYAWLAYGIESALGLVNPRKIEMRILYYPVKYDSTLLTFLELTDTNSGLQMKKLLIAAAIQSNTDIWIEGNSIDVSRVSERFLDDMITGSYVLKTSDPEMIIAEDGKVSTTLQKVSTKLFDLDGYPVDLELYVG
jgi:hypothetical protein